MPFMGLNEAAGFTRRKHGLGTVSTQFTLTGFNEAAGFTRRKPAGGGAQADSDERGFNEAAGFTRRKPTAWTLPTSHCPQWLQ